MLGGVKNQIGFPWAWQGWILVVVVALCGGGWVCVFKFTFYPPPDSSPQAAVTPTHTLMNRHHAAPSPNQHQNPPPLGPGKSDLVLHPHPASWLEPWGKNLGAQLLSVFHSGGKLMSGRYLNIPLPYFVFFLYLSFFLFFLFFFIFSSFSKFSFIFYFI